MDDHLFDQQIRDLYAAFNRRDSSYVTHRMSPDVTWPRAFKGGVVHGATDEFGSAAVTDKVHVHDLHATILQCMGFDHTKLTYRFNGRDFRLTDVAGNVVKPVLA